MKQFIGTLFVAGALCLAGCQSDAPAEENGAQNSAQEMPAAPMKLAVEDAINNLDQMRSGLAGTMDTDNVDATTFAQVCKPVGMQAKKLSSDNGWVVKQVATKYRNPGNKADPEVGAVIEQFAQDASLNSRWMRSEMDGRQGWRYLQRITVEEPCLACHGSKDERPAFIKEKYAEDHAFDFAVGDIRGLYSVFVPDAVER